MKEKLCYLFLGRTILDVNQYMVNTLWSAQWGCIGGCAADSFQSNNKHSADLIHLAWELQIDLYIIGYISIEEFYQATRFGDCTHRVTENIVAISWLVGDRREVSGCFPAYTSATPAATCHQHPRAQNCTPTLPLCSHSSGNLSCSQIWKSKPIPFLYS